MKKNKIALIGAGNWGKNYLRVLEKLGVLAALAEKEASVREKYASLYPQLYITDDYKKLLTNPAIDAFVVATPAHTHYQIAQEILLANKDVLLEKPMTLSVSEAKTLHKIAEKNRGVLLVGHLLLYKPAIQKIKELIENKILGDLLCIDMKRAKLGTIRNYENVLWSFAPHDLAVLLSLVKAKVTEINAVGQKLLQAQREDNIHLYLHFANNVHAHVHLSWLWPEDERKMIIIGTKGMLVYDENNDTIVLHRKGILQEENLEIFDNGTEEFKFTKTDLLEKEILHFLDCIQTRSKPLTDAESGVAVIEILERASASLQKTKLQKNYFAHQSAWIDEDAQIGDGTQVWHYSHIMGAVIGQNCKIGQNVFIASNVRIGNNVKIQNNVSVYEGVTLEDDVFCGPSMVFTNVSTPRSAYPRNASTHYEKTLVKRGASIGANATIRCGIVVGEYALVGAGAVVTKNVPAHAIVYGNPATIKGWICRCGKVRAGVTAERVECSDCKTLLRPKIN